MRVRSHSIISYQISNILLVSSLQMSWLPGGHDQDLCDPEIDFSQLSQPSRIVQVPNNGNHDHHVGLVISKIEDVFESMIDVLAHEGDALSIPYRSRTAPADQPARALRFPGTTVQEATKFSKYRPCAQNTHNPSDHEPWVARMIRIMELCREALVAGRLITKRSAPIAS